MFLTYIFDNLKPYKNINDVLNSEYNFSNRLFTKLIKNNCIYLNNEKCDTRSSLKIGDIITIDLSYEEESLNIVPTKMDLDIIYEDEWFLIVNKPAGIAIHPSILHFKDSLSNGIKFYFNNIKLHKKVRPVNRLDLNTSGLVIFAKCEYIQEELSRQMQRGIFKKEYLCIAQGTFENKKGTINLPIGRKPGSIIERCVNENGQNSTTNYNVLSSFDNYSLIQCSLESGRTHQIRVHMSAIGHPLVGDTLYGNYSSLISRQALHSYILKFVHPITKKQMEFNCPLPSDIQKLITL